MANLMTPSPLLGTAYILSQSPSSNSASSVQKTPITPSLCANLSAFKSLLRQSRALDDSVILRLNRAHALARANPALRECDAFWKELVERWTERGRVLGFCEGVVVRTMDGEEGGKGEGKVPIEVRLDRDRAAKVGRGESEGELKQRMIQNEIRVEEVIRARSLSFFLSRCPDHPQLPAVPPLPAILDDEFVERKRL